MYRSYLTPNGRMQDVSSALIDRIKNLEHRINILVKQLRLQDIELDELKKKIETKEEELKKIMTGHWFEQMTAKEMKKRDQKLIEA